MNLSDLKTTAEELPEMIIYRFPLTGYDMKYMLDVTGTFCNVKLHQLHSTILWNWESTVGLDAEV